MIKFGSSKKEEKLRKGKFIVIDGIDGSGKSTQLGLLQSELEISGYRVKNIHFPKHGEPSALLVDKYLSGEYGQLNSYAASVFFAVDRFDSASEIRKWLIEGNIVLCDRYVTANAGHQGGKIPDHTERVKFFRWLDNLEYTHFNIPKPDLNIILNVPPEAAQQLLMTRITDPQHNDTIHEKSLDHLKNSAESYKELAKLFPNTKLVDCTEEDRILEPKTIHNKIWELVRRIALKDITPHK